jgi:hypothetical protein
MATFGSAVYDDLLDVLSDGVDKERLLRFRLSEAKQAQLDLLLQKNREGSLTKEESAELDDFERFEHMVRMLKARALSTRPAPP